MCFWKKKNTNMFRVQVTCSVLKWNTLRHKTFLPNFPGMESTRSVSISHLCACVRACVSPWALRTRSRCTPSWETSEVGEKLFPPGQLSLKYKKRAGVKKGEEEQTCYTDLNIKQIHLFWFFFPPKRTSSLSREKFGSWLVKPNIIYNTGSIV